MPARPRLARLALLGAIGLMTSAAPYAQPDRTAEAGALAERGRAELASGRFRGAVETLSGVVELHRRGGDGVGEAGALVQLAAAYRRLGRNADGLHAGRRALALCVAAADRRCEAESHYQIGTFHFWMGQYREALAHYGESLSRWEALGDRAAQGRLLTEMGWLHWTSGASALAIEHYLRSLPLSVAAGDSRNEGYTRNNLGLAYSYLGDIDAAIDHFERALLLRRAAGDAGGEAQTLGNMCYVHWTLGEYQRSLEVCRTALELAERASDRETQAWALDTLGLVYWSLGDPQRALEQHREALASRQAIDDRHGLAATLNNIGWTHLALGRRTEARNYFQSSLEASRAVNDPRSEGRALNNLGLTAFHDGDLARSVAHLEEALRLRRLGGDRRGEGQSLHNLGRTHETRGEHERAADRYRAARELFRSIGDRSNEAGALLALAAHAAGRDDLPLAQRLGGEALALAETLRSGVTGPDLRASFLAVRQNYYDLYIDVLMRRHRREPRAGHDRLALHISERARARSLLETLSQARGDIREGVDPALLDRELRLLRRLASRERSRMELLSRPHTPAQSAAADAGLAALVREHQDLQAEIRARSPRYAAVTQPQPLTSDDIQARVLDDQSLLLEYRLGDAGSHLWAVTRTSARGYALPPRARVEAAARRFYSLLTESRSRLARAQTERAAAELGAMLLGPVAHELGRKRLLIVADGILNYIPFAALADPGGDAGCAAGPYCPLIVGHEIVSLPSASVIDVIRREAAARPRASRTLAVFSDPVFAASDVRVVPAREPSAGAPPFERLTFSRREADAVLALLPRERTLRAVDFEASRARVLQPDLADYRFVHFATHGVVDSERPELSGLVLSLVDPSGRPADGLLRVHDLFNLRLGADLVVLSACRTALGQEVKGEGIVGLTRAFMYAGSPRVVASLWDVRDRSTAELMTRFYGGIVDGGLSPAAALRAAQVAMWRGGAFAAPFHWAGFILQGEWR